MEIPKIRMRSITAVEIGADTCALASTSVRAGQLRIAAAETLDPAAFPGIDAFTLALEQTRRASKLPRRCRAVVWGLPDGATRKDPIVAPLIEPLTRAGFWVVRVVTPCNALGALARLRTSRAGGAMCWLGINRNGVAIVVIRPGKLLYSHSFAWDSNVGASGSQARLLQRYSLVAFLAPEVRRGIAAAKKTGTTVDGIVTCGNLPDLRALTMPLIEELDIEVETLDSLEGLEMKPELADKLSEVAPAIRLACAGAFARETRSVDEYRRRRAQRSARVGVLVKAAALAAVLGVAGYVWYLRTRPAPRLAPKPAPVTAAAPKPVTVAPSVVHPAAAPQAAAPAKPLVVAPPSPAVTTPPVAVPAVLRGRNLIVGTIAGMPICSIDALNASRGQAGLRRADDPVAEARCARARRGSGEQTDRRADDAVAEACRTRASRGSASSERSMST